MDTKCYELLSILNYPISEDLFKEKIGTGDDLERLVEEKVLIEDFKHYQVNFDSYQITNVELSNNISKLHKNIIQTYYLKIIDKEINSDYESFFKGYREYINLSYHYRELGEFDNAIQYIFSIAKKLTFWGLGEDLIKELDQYKECNLNKENYLWKQYYIFFYELIYPMGNIDATQFLSFIEIVEQQDAVDSRTLYLEIKNLEGIYYKQVEKDNEKAITIFKTAIQRYKNPKNHSDKELRLSYARILENLAISINQSNIEETNKYFAESENIFREYNDKYELAKLYFFKLALLNNTNEPDQNLIIQEHYQLSKVLKECTFPDIERNLFNLLSNKVFVEYDDFNRYIELKIHALTRDLVLYYENFEMDFFDILRKIETIIKSQDIKIDGSIDLLLEFLYEVKLMEEFHFIEGIKARLLGKDVNAKLNEIENKDLKKFAYEYVEGLAINR